MRVIWLMRGPGIPKGTVVDARPALLIDVAPTIMSVSGVRPAAAGEAGAGDDREPPPPMPGISLLDLGDASPPMVRDIVAERVLYGPETKAIVSWPYKAILELESSEARLFDLSVDPGEQRDLAAERPDDLNELLGRLSDALAAAKALGAGVEAELDPELLRRLRALGYIR